MCDLSWEVLSVYLFSSLSLCPDRAAPALFLCPLAHPDRSLS